MNVFMAGASGAIGRSLVPRLVAAGHDVTGTTRSQQRAEMIRAAGARAPALGRVPKSHPDVTGWGAWAPSLFWLRWGIALTRR